MKRRSAGVRLAFAALAVLVAALAGAWAATASSGAGSPTTTLGVTPTVVEGNPSCSTAGYGRCRWKFNCMGYRNRRAT